jgi:hypothetical protein
MVPRVASIDTNDHHKPNMNTAVWMDVGWQRYTKRYSDVDITLNLNDQSCRIPNQ